MHFKFGSFPTVAHHYAFVRDEGMGPNTPVHSQTAMATPVAHSFVRPRASEAVH